MKNKRLRRKIIIVSIIVVLFMLSKYLILNWTDIRAKLLIFSEKDVYDENWELEDIYIGKDSPTYMTFVDKRTLTIVLIEKNVPRYLDMENISDIFWAFRDIFLVDNKELYGDFVLHVDFYDEMTQLCSIYYYEGRVYIEDSGWLMSIDDIVENFPETRCIRNNYIMLYRELSSIEGFEDLQYLSFSSVISEEDFNTYMEAETNEKFLQAHDELSFSNEEKNIILSYFPNCLIE